MSIDSKNNMPSSRITNATARSDGTSNRRAAAAAVRSTTIVKSCMKKASASARRQQQPNQKSSTTTKSGISGTNSSVRFNPRTSVRVIPTLDNYTDEELISCFWSEQDDIASKDHIVETVKAIRAGELDDDSDNDQHCCSRGLEQLATVRARDEVKQRRQRILHAVMDEQDFQWSQNIEDDVRIAIMALRESVPSRKKALVTAAQDAAYVPRMEVSFASQYMSKSSIDREVVKRSGRNHSSPLSRNAKTA